MQHKNLYIVLLKSDASTSDRKVMNPKNAIKGNNLEPARKNNMHGIHPQPLASRSSFDAECLHSWIILVAGPCMFNTKLK